MELDPTDEVTLATIYPYRREPGHHPLAPLFFNSVVKADLEVADALAKHIFDRLGCSPPRNPSVKYDALGSSGAPWEPGAWIDATAERMAVHVTVSEKPVADMDAAERAQLRRELEAADAAERAGTLRGAR